MFMRYLQRMVRSIERIVQILEVMLRQSAQCSGCPHCLQHRHADTEASCNEIFRDMEYVLDRVGISDRTLLRYQKSGKINVAKRVHGRKYYRDIDVERFRGYYHGVR